MENHREIEKITCKTRGCVTGAAVPGQTAQTQQQQRPVLRVGSQVNLVGGRFDGRPAIIREWLGTRGRWGVELTGADL